MIDGSLGRRRARGKASPPCERADPPVGRARTVAIGSGLGDSAGCPDSEPRRVGPQRLGVGHLGADGHQVVPCGDLLRVVEDLVALVLQAVPDDLERQEVLALLAQHPAQPLDVVLVELAVARRRALGVDEALALEEADLRDGDVGELLAQQA